VKKLIVLALLVFAGFKFYQNGFSVSSPKGAFDENGNPMVVLFTAPNCGEHCEKIRLALARRGVDFEEIDVAGEDGSPVSNKYGVNGFPITLIGKQEIRGDDMLQITSALAENYGKEVLTRMESVAMDGHFDADGHAKVVMYGTSWCPYCKRQRAFFAENDIPYEEIDVEESELNKTLFNVLQGNGYPLIYVGYRRFSGYKEKEVVTAMKELSGTVRR
jgi:glutaredoxin